MPCLVLTGHPSVGKSTVAKQFEKRALSRKDIQKVVIVDERMACPGLTQSQCYENSHAEKKTRAALKGCFDRVVAKASMDTLVLLDSMNYIKGFRYELFCISKAAGQQHGVVWILNSMAVAKEWNHQRDSHMCYSQQLMEELMQRFEPPDQRNRWDKPLYKIDMHTPQGAQQHGPEENVILSQSVYNMHALSDVFKDDATTPQSTVANNTDKPKKKFSGFKRAKKPQETSNQQSTQVKLQSIESPVEKVEPTAVVPQSTLLTTESQPTIRTLEEQVDTILDSFLLNVKPLKEGASTTLHIAGDSNVMHECDSITLNLCHVIVTAQNNQVGLTTQLPIPSNDQTLFLKCSRKLHLPELKRLRKQYLRWVTTNPPDDSSEHAIAASFLAYVETNI